MKACFSYRGAKVRTARYYPQPRHKRVVEPFSGLAGYSHLHYANDVVLRDVSPDIISTWEYIQRLTDPQVAERLPATWGQIDLDDYPDLEPGARNLIGFNLKRASTVPMRKGGRKWFHEYRNCFWNPEMKQRVVSQASLISHWDIALGDYSSVELDVGTWFIDAPYHYDGHQYRHNRLDRPELARWISSLPGQIIICESLSREGEVPRWWRDGREWQHFSAEKLVTGTTTGQRSGRELIWYCESQNINVIHQIPANYQSFEASDMTSNDDDETYPEPRWLDRLLEAKRTSPDPDAGAIKLFEPVRNSLLSDGLSFSDDIIKRRIAAALNRAKNVGLVEHIGVGQYRLVEPPLRSEERAQLQEDPVRQPFDHADYRVTTPMGNVLSASTDTNPELFAYALLAFKPAGSTKPFTVTSPSGVLTTLPSTLDDQGFIREVGRLMR